MLIKVWIAKHGAQIVIVTIPSLEGESLEEYATETFRKFGIGDKNKNNGLLILIALQERKSRIEVGYGLEGVLPDAKTGRIQNQYMLPYLRQNKWDEGIKNGFNEFVSIISKNYDVEIEQEKAEKVEKSPISDPLLVFSFSALAGYIMVIIPFSYEYYKPRKLLIILKETILAIIYAIALSVIIYFETKNTSVIINDVIWGIIGYIIGGCAQGISYIFKKRWWRLLRRIRWRFRRRSFRRRFFWRRPVHQEEAGSSGSF